MPRFPPRQRRYQVKLPDHELAAFDRIAAMANALASRNRLVILHTLAHDPNQDWGSKELANVLGISPGRTYVDLRFLENGGIIERTQVVHKTLSGRPYQCYRIRKGWLDDLFQFFREFDPI